MKAITKVLAGIFLLIAMYLTITDGMMTCFGLSQGTQYAVNYATIFIIIPACVIHLFDSKKEETKS